MYCLSVPRRLSIPYSYISEKLSTAVNASTKAKPV
jgi:hypothetical protein